MEGVMTRIGIAGAAGKMGSRITALSREYEGLQLSGVLERKGHKDIGMDIGILLGIGKLGINFSDNIEEIIDKIDLLIDFTSVESTKSHLETASNKGKAMVIGTTGFSKDDLKEIEPLAKSIPCVMASNMSLGVNLLLKVLQDIARVLGDDFDIEIIIAEAVNRNLEEYAVFTRKGMIGARSKKEIGIQTVRAGDIVGEHTVLFGGLGERIEITHKATSRDTFARGALKAALWLAGKPAGLYDMQDVLGLK
jgi:4-hydroxy-tetrahydrodipicolinate reductase